ncbi:hypothetical protein H8356DRAFT_1280526 [Neocallimastix lanati (nom. inval.)]|nr:hypothetical protein H8356DRAFT_1280526 [Neocallimastix sp. JGI-2020a]
MTKEFILNKEQFLNGSNFDPWFGRIKTALETRKLVKYINKDVIASIKENFPNDIENERFFNEINNIVTFKLYAGDSKLIEENLDQYFVHDRTQDNENETSINLISKYTNRKIKNKNNFKYKHKTHNNKYCYICEKKGHTTKECRYNKKRKHYSNEESSSESENENENKQKQLIYLMYMNYFLI